MTWRSFWEQLDEKAKCFKEMLMCRLKAPPGEGVPQLNSLSQGGVEEGGASPSK
jgi:hypothetical protein